MTDNDLIKDFLSEFLKTPLTDATLLRLKKGIAYLSGHSEEDILVSMVGRGKVCFLNRLPGENDISFRLRFVEKFGELK